MTRSVAIVYPRPQAQELFEREPLLAADEFHDVDAGIGLLHLGRLGGGRRG
jgi:hypothetical protein